VENFAMVLLCTLFAYVIIALYFNTTVMSKSEVKKLTKEEVIHIANLANIQLSDDEVEKYRAELAQILQYMEIIQEVDTGEEGFVSQTDLVNVFREDIAKDSLSQEDAVSNRKDDSKGGAIKISAVISK
jgi:aspartyl-tRNA(Asn)/glutamyl-tRNA(Gln) amidotransferase subunit C